MGYQAGQKKMCRLLVGVSTAMIAGMGTIAPAAAAPDPSDVTITGGSLGIGSVPQVSDFLQVTLDGSPRSTIAALGDFTVVDARGTGAGWSLTVAATPFRQWDTGLQSYVPGGTLIPAGSLSMPAPEVAASSGTTSPAPALMTGPFTLDAGTVTIASAPATTGMGSYLFTQTGSVVLAIPAATYVGTYRSEVTISVTTGP